MEWCEELYREMSFEEFIRRGMRTMLVLLLFLSFVLGVDNMTSGKERSEVHMGNVVFGTVGEGALTDAFEISQAAVSSVEREKKSDPLTIVPGNQNYETMLTSEKGLDGNSVQAETPEILEILTEVSEAVPSVSAPNNDIPAPGLSAADPFVPDIPAAENNGFDAPPSDVPITENNGSDIPELGDEGTDVPALDIPPMEEEETDVPALDIPESGDEGLDIPETDTPVSDSSDSESVSEDNEDSIIDENTGKDASISGFIVDESGMICGISDMSLAVTDMCLYLPDEGCTGIAFGAFSGVTEEIVDIYIPSNITNIEEGAFLGLPYVCKYEVESGNGTYYTENGVLFADGGACLLAFPVGRTGTYSVPASVTRFADDAFTGSMLSKLDIRSCALEGFGNLPESITVQ